jgi:hypothetical protein
MDWSAYVVIAAPFALPVWTIILDAELRSPPDRSEPPEDRASRRTANATIAVAAVLVGVLQRLSERQRGLLSATLESR